MGTLRTEARGLCSIGRTDRACLIALGRAFIAINGAQPMAEFNPPRQQWDASIMRVKMLFRVVSQVETYQCTLYYRPDSSATFATATTLAEFNAAWRVACLVSLQGVLPDTAIIRAIIVDDLHNPALLPNEEVLIATPGLVAEEFMPPFVQCTFRIQTAIRGKKGRGRIQLPLVPETFFEGGLISAAGLTAYDAFRDDIKLTINTGTPVDSWKLCVAKRDELLGDGTWRCRVERAVEVFIREDAGSQDRRKWGRGS